MARPGESASWTVPAAELGGQVSGRCWGEVERASGSFGLAGGVLVRCQWSGGHPSGVRGRESDEGERGVSWQLGLPRSSPILVSLAC